MSVRVEVVDVATTRELRRAVLRPHWPPGSAMTSDDDDAVHLGAFDGETLVGACLVLPRTYPLRPDLADAWQLRGMATAADQQGTGVGSAVLGAAIDEVASRGGRLVWCAARISAQPFYERHGFRPEGAQYIQQETELPHVRMWRELSADPTSSG